MRKRISESNLFPKFDLFDEYQKIEYLISENRVIGIYDPYGFPKNPCWTIEEFVDYFGFLEWKLRGTFLSIAEMRYGLGINKEVFAPRNINGDIVLDFLQYVANLHIWVKSILNKHSRVYISDQSYLNALMKNLCLLVNFLGAEIAVDSKSSEAYIVYRDNLSTVVAEDNPDISSSLSEYRRIDNRGDLKRKGEILCTLFKKLESVEKKFKGTTYANLCSDTTFLFNKTGVRHWIENDKTASKTFLTMQPEELEKWYDRTFDSFLSCMVISRYLDFKKELDEIKRTE